MNALIFSFSVNALWGVGIFGAVIAFAVIALFWATSKTSRYIDDIIYIETAVTQWHPTPDNYRNLKECFFQIMEYNMDAERTGKAYAKFFLKYEQYVKAEVFKSEVKKVNQEVEV
jgi:hypothetical protein